VIAMFRQNGNYVYNYLELNSLNEWPKEKKIALLKLLDIS